MNNTPLSQIKPYEKNAKKHPLQQIDKIAKSIQEFGFNQPLVLDKDNVIIVGHGRYLAAKKLGLEEVPTITLDLTEQQAKAYRLADNKLNESDWEMDLVIEDLKLLDDNLVVLTGIDLPSLYGETVESPENEWINMPEFNQQDKTPYKQIIVSFKNEEDIKSFSFAVDQSITKDTRSIWFPKKENQVLKNKAYV